jgi:outer membrane protein insertion porin family/translocation and assembly module TamA
MGRPVAAWRAHFHLVLAIPALFCAPGILAQSTPPRDRTHPVVDEVTFIGVTKVVDKADLAGGLATKPSGCRSLLLKPFCLLTQSHVVYDTKTLDHTELARDVVRIKVYYYKRGYRETEVDTTVTRAQAHSNRVRVSFRITEGKPVIVQSIAVQQAESLVTGRLLRRAVLVHAGEPLNLIDLDSTHVHLRDALWDKGYADALIGDTIVVHDSARTAEVRIGIDPRWVATVESVTVHGDSILSPDIVQKMITLRPGNIYKRENVIESQQAMYSSNLFRRATIVLPPRGDSAKLIDINVNEARLHAVKLSAGFNTIDFIQTEGKFTNFNFLGNARQLNLHLVVSNLLAPALNGTGIFRDVLADNGLPGDSSSDTYLKPTYQASIDVTQRWFGDPRNTVSLGLFAHRTSAPGIYVDKGYGTSLSFTRNVAPRTPLSLVYRYELTQVTAGDVYFCVNYGQCEQSTISLLRSNNALSPVSLDFYMDRTNDGFNPSEGGSARADFEHASKYTLSDFRYNRASGEVTLFHQIGKAVLAGHLRGGWVRAMSSTSTSSTDGLSDILHPRKRFYAGGANSVRGYGENQLGPRILTVDPAKLIAAGCTTATIANASCDPNTSFVDSLGKTHTVDPNDFTALPTGGTSLIEGSIEYRFPVLMKNLQAAVFVDAGYVGAGSSDATQGKAAVTPGFGVRYLSPVGPIRVDLGFRPSLTDHLTVITETVQPDGSHRLVQLAMQKAYNPVAGGSGISKVLNRLALHLSIGQAF